MLVEAFESLIAFEAFWNVLLLDEMARDVNEGEGEIEGDEDMGE